MADVTDHLKATETSPPPPPPPSPTATPKPKRARRWLRRAWLPAAFFLIGLLLGAAIGAGDSGDSKKVADLEARLADTRAQLRRSAGNLSALQDQVSRTAQRESELTQRERELDDREAAIAAAEAARNANTFGDGLYEVGVDIQPGKYKTDGASGGCYYALLTSPVDTGFDNIVDNNNFNGPATVILESPYFEAAGGCTWTKVG